MKCVINRSQGKIIFKYIFVQFMKRPNLTSVNIVEVLFHKWVTCIVMLGKHTMLNQTKLEVDEKENSWTNCYWNWNSIKCLLCIYIYLSNWEYKLNKIPILFFIFASIDEPVSHCYFTRLNLRKMGPFYFYFPVFLGINRHPKHKEFLNSFVGFLRAALTGHSHPSPFWKIAKMALFNPSMKFLILNTLHTS